MAIVPWKCGLSSLSNFNETLEDIFPYSASLFRVRTTLRRTLDTFPNMVTSLHVLVNRVRGRQVTVETGGNHIRDDVIQRQVTDVLVVIGLGHAVPGMP